MLSFLHHLAPTELCTLSLHDALPICWKRSCARSWVQPEKKKAVSPSTCTVPWTLQGPFCSTKSGRSEEHTSELQSHSDLVCRLLLEKKNMSNLFGAHHKDASCCFQQA